MIRVLKKEVSEAIRSSYVIQDLPQAIKEIVENSIDANATTIDIEFNSNDFSFTVRDNGDGISEESLQNMGQRFATSKCDSTNDLEKITTHGFRGEAIASISEHSIIEIITRTSNAPCSYSKIIRNGEAMNEIKMSSTQRTKGTTVIVNNLFYNLPVRRNLFKPSLQSDKIKQTIIQLSLLKTNISFSLFDRQKNSIVFKRSKGVNITQTFCNTFGSQFQDTLRDVSWENEKEKWQLNGVINDCNSNRKNRDLQFFYVNERHIVNKEIYKAIDKVFGGSNQDYNRVNYKSFATQPTRVFPYYILNLTCPFDFYDVTFDIGKFEVEFKDEEKLINWIEKTLKEFFTPDCLKKLKAEEEEEKKKQIEEEKQNFSFSSSLPSQSSSPLPSSSSSSSSSPSSSLSSFSSSPLLNFCSSSAGVSPVIDFNFNLNDQKKSFPFPIVDKLMPNENEDLILMPSSPAASSLPPSLISSPYKFSQNVPIIKPRNKRAPQQKISNFSYVNISKNNFLFGNNVNLPIAFNITKEMLKRMTVLNQVDKKYILALCDNYLFAFDQHAVHERIRLEALEKLPISIKFVDQIKTKVTSNEVQLLNRFEHQLESWGFSFSILESHSDNFDNLEIEVTLYSVPCLLDKYSLTVDDLKEFIFQLERSGGSNEIKPKAINRILSSKACRGAVKFGDSLSVNECAQLICQLSDCQLPFQCAHGRINVSPLFDLKSVI